ncbi:MAG: hypothetical protein HOO93_12660 [Methyloglobulus sp.]|nr:hypothetical protein [Methyloglobulus sp.]
MKQLFFFFIINFIFACSTTQESRHQDFTNLEKPPGAAKLNQTEDPNQYDKSKESETDSSKGLNSDVYRLEERPKEIIIKRNIDQSWVALDQAIRLNELKIIEKNRKHYRYKLSYKTGGLLDGFSLFGSTKASTYLLTLDSKDDKTRIIASKVEDEGDIDPSRLMDGAPDYSYDSSSKLADLIFETLRKDVRN